MANPPAAGSPDSLTKSLEAGEQARRLGNFAEGAELARGVMDAAADDLHYLARAQRLLALCLTRLGEPEDAVHVCERAVDSFRRLDDETHLSEMLTAQAYAFTLLGLTTEALDALAESRGIAQRLQDPELLFWVYSRMGNVHNELGSWDEAEGFLLQAYRRLPGLDNEAHFSINNNLALNAFYRAKLARSRGELPGAIIDRGLGHAGTAAEIGGRLTNPFLTGTALMNLSMLQALDGNTVLAKQTLERSIAISVNGGYRGLEVSARQCVAEVLLIDDEPAAAAELIERTMLLAIEIGERHVELELLTLLAEAYEKTEQYELALAAFKKFHALDGELRSDVTAIRARLLTTDLELDGARNEAQQARLESEAERAQAQALRADNEALQVRASELYASSLQDPLTRLGNRRQLESTLPALFEAAHTARQVFCLAVIDIDAFKRVNDTFGHAVGDQVLVRVATLLGQSSRRGDLVGRLGGEEFLIAFPDMDLGAAQSICERLRVSVEEEDWSWVSPGHRITVSIGVQPMVGCDDVWQQVDRADRAMYRAKQSGRNRVAVGAAGGSSGAGDQRP